MKVMKKVKDLAAIGSRRFRRHEIIRDLHRKIIVVVVHVDEKNIPMMSSFGLDGISTVPTQSRQDINQ